MNNYTIYHLHSDLSNAFTVMDSVTKYESYIKQAEKLGMKAMAFAEHGSVLQWVKKKEAIEKSGMKYIHAIEAYVTEGLDDIKRDNYHVILIAKNWDGVKEINKLSSKSFDREDKHYFYNPRITYKELKSLSDDVIITTSCLKGLLYSAPQNIKDDFIKFLSENKHRAFLEVQHHNVKEQAEYNKYLYELSQQINVSLIAGTDTHSLNAEYAEGRELLQKRKGIHFDNEDGWDLTLKSYEDLVECFKQQGILPENVYLDAIENTNKMAEMIEPFELDRSHKYPKAYSNSEEVFKNKINQGWKERSISSKDNIAEYHTRVQYEFDVMKNNGSIDYMLLEEKIKSNMRKQDVYAGYSRGSVSGSLIAYLLKITDIDSIKFDMNFSRFMNKERVSLCDIDSDWSPEDRPKVKEYVHNIPNLYTSEIVTFNTIALKGAIRDVGGALDMELSIVDSISKSVENNEDSLRIKYPKLFKYVDLLRGTITSIGVHPAATIVSPLPLEEHMGTFTSSTCDYPVSQLNMKEVDGLNFVKLDILGLDNVGVINNASKKAEISRLVPDDMNFEDERVWENLIKSPVGIFQFEKPHSHSYLKQLLSRYKDIKEQIPTITKVDLMSLANGAIRPAGDSYREEMGRGVIKDNGNEALNEIMGNTMGYCTFQESIIEFLHKFCGFTMGEADVVRRHIGKKENTEQDLPKIKAGFIKTATEQYDIPREKAETDIINFLQIIQDASNYLFSKNHSDPYTFIGFATAYLRTYHPLEFISTLLDYNEERLEKTAKIVEYAETIANIKIKPPKFRYSSAHYTPNKDGDSIYKGIASIKTLSSKVGEQLYLLKDNEYNSFVEALPDILDTGINDGQIEVLIKLGYFSEFGKSKTLLEIFNIYNSLKASKVINKGKYDEEWEDIIIKHSTQTPKQFRNLDNIAIINELIEKIEDKNISIKELIACQIEYLGYININLDTHKSNCVVLKIDTKYSPKVTMMSLATGTTITAKIYKNMLPDIEEGDMIKVTKIFQEDGWKKDNDDKWIKDPTKKVWRLKSFKKLAEREL